MAPPTHKARFSATPAIPLRHFWHGPVPCCQKRRRGASEEDCLERAPHARRTQALRILDLAYFSLFTMPSSYSSFTHFGEREFHEQAEVVKKLEADMSEVDDWVETADKEAEEARVKLNRSCLTRLSLAPHAASLRMEAAAMVGENTNLASAQAKYDAAYAELNNALDQDLAEGIRLEGEGVFTNPCPDAVYSSGFGYRSFDNAYRLGLDMAIGEGTPYYL